MQSSRPTALALALALLIATPACKEDEPRDDGSTVTYTEQRPACQVQQGQRQLLWGDLHAHTTYSWDAFGYDLMVTPAEAYQFAMGGTVMLPPLDSAGKGTRPARLERPLDFAGITDHAEFLGETHLCRTVGSASYNSDSCKSFRLKGTNAVSGWGMQLVAGSGQPRQKDICGADGKHCSEAAARVWKDIRAAAESAYDRTAACKFVSFVGYEYTATPKVSNMHRNVIFRNDKATTLPVSYYEAPHAYGLWKALAHQCLDKESGCDVMVIPHNSNWSNGMLFDPELSRGDGGASLAQALTLRARLEPLLEIFQHKGDMECRNGLSGMTGATDPLCAFEKLRQDPVPDCGEGTGFGGVQEAGCVSRLDFLRGALVKGMQLKDKHGHNPYRVGVIGSTDSHNGTPGNTWESTWPGHVGVSDDTATERLGKGNMTHRGLINNPGGLAGVWAVENSRDAIFQAMRRKETYATSGTRIKLRFFGGWDMPQDVCSQKSDQAVIAAYRAGVPMGGVLPPRESGAPTFLLQAVHDAGTTARPGARLAGAQVIKLWLDSAGAAHQKVFDLLAPSASKTTVDPRTCKRTGQGVTDICSRWQDPEFKPGQPALYYARVVEDPSCRWSTWLCNQIDPTSRPAGCDSKTTQKVIQERAWSSAIWYQP